MTGKGGKSCEEHHNALRAYGAMCVLHVCGHRVQARLVWAIVQARPYARARAAFFESYDAPTRVTCVIRLSCLCPPPGAAGGNVSAAGYVRSRLRQNAALLSTATLCDRGGIPIKPKGLMGPPLLCRKSWPRKGVRVLTNRPSRASCRDSRCRLHVSCLILL
jgi:hypothetical protein